MDLDNLNINITAFTERAQASIGALAGALRGLIPHSRQATENLDELARTEQETTESSEKASKSHGKLSASLKKLGSAVLGARKSIKDKFTPDLNKGFLIVLKYAFGIRSLFVALKKLRSAIKDGFGNLRQYSDEVDSSLTTMTNSLTQVKNALAVAFSPIVTAIVPYVRALANAITVLLNKLAQLLGALTGRSFVVQADTSFGDIASGVDAVGGSAGGSKKKVDELKKALMGFDEINKLPDASDVGSGGGGGGGGGGASNINDMFKTVEVDNSIKDFAQLLKDSWSKADFTEVGVIIGDKLNGALQNINWTNIRATASKMGSSLSTFINGALSSNVDGQSIGTTVGNTIGNAINTGIQFFRTSGAKLNFGQIGRTLADGLNGVFETFDWYGLGRTINIWATGLIEAIGEFLSNVDGGELVSGIIQFVDGLDFLSILGAITDNIGKLLPSLSDLKTLGGNIVGGIFEGILEFTKDPIRYIKRVFDAIVKGFKKVFGIHSPAKAPEIRSIGKNIVLGILEGFSSGFGKIGEWAKKLKDKIGEKVKKAKEKALEIKDILGEKLSGIGDWVSGIKESISEKWGETKETLKGGFDATVDFVAGKIDEGLDWLFGKDENGDSNQKRTLDVSVPSGVDTMINNIKTAWANFRSSTSGDKRKRTLDSSLSYKENGKSSNDAGVLKKVKTWWSGLFGSGDSKSLKSTFTSTGESTLNAVKTKWDGIKSGTKRLTLALSGTGATLIQRAKENWEKIKTKTVGLTSSIKLPHISWGTKTWTKGPVSINYPWPSVSWYAKGGFPEDGWFRANHGEVMGKFDNGQSVVANNMQITEGISRAVERGMVKAFLVANGSNGGSQGNSQQPIIVQVGDRTVYSGFVDYIRKTTYATGNNPILI